MEYKWKVLSNTTVATLMAAIDTNIVLISLPTIGRQLPDTSAVTLFWILIGYSLVTAVLLLNFGRLSDLFGRVRLYGLGFVTFTVGSALCGLSQNGPELVGFRLVQAVGAAFLFANSAAIITDAFPPNERGRALGINQISIVAGAVVGLVLGGLITSTIGWRWIFFVNVPLGLIATYRAYRDLHEIALRASRPRIDWLGNLTFGLGLTMLLLGITLGALGQITDDSGLLLSVGGLGVLALFLVIESTVEQPMLNLSLFRIRQFSSSAFTSLLNALARGAFTFVLVFYLQGPPRFLSAYAAGLFLIPVSASLAAFGLVSGFLSDRYGPRPFLVAGLVASAAGFLWLSTIGPTESFLQLTPPLLLAGSGMGLFASPNRAAMMTAVPPEHRGIGSAVGTTFVNTGSTISIGITLLIMAEELPRAALQAIFVGASVPEPTTSIAAGFLIAIHHIFLVAAVLILVGLLPTLLRGRSPPRSRPGRPVRRPHR